MTSLCGCHVCSSVANEIHLLKKPPFLTFFRQISFMTNKRFTVRNETFICESCGQNVPVRNKSCRNHCPFCLASKHVDINPGDRANPCGGLQQAIGYEITGNKGLVLIFRCQRCQATTRNVAAREDEETPDDFDKILELSKNPRNILTKLP